MKLLYPMRATAALLILASALAHAKDEAVNDGTDPTRLTTSLLIQYKHTDLRTADATGLFEASFTRPLDEAKRMSLGLTVPYASGVMESDYSLGDVSVKFTHVVDLNRERGLVYTAEVFFLIPQAVMNSGQARPF